MRCPRYNESGSTRAALNDVKQAQYDEYYRDDEQGMDPTAGVREAWTDALPEETERPQDH
jgi:hypothetical protein